MARTLNCLFFVAVLSLLMISGTRATSAEKLAVASNHEVRMKSNKFDQKDIQIAVGDTVSWLNDDGVKHSVTTDAGSEITITEIIVEAAEHSGRIKFDKAGLFKYKCKFHMGMTGTINVTAR